MKAGVRTAAMPGARSPTTDSSGAACAGRVAGAICGSGSSCVQGRTPRSATLKSDSNSTPVFSMLSPRLHAVDGGDDGDNLGPCFTENGNGPSLAAGGRDIFEHDDDVVLFRAPSTCLPCRSPSFVPTKMDGSPVARLAAVTRGMPPSSARARRSYLDIKAGLLGIDAPRTWAQADRALRAGSRRGTCQGNSCWFCRSGA